MVPLLEVVFSADRFFDVVFSADRFLDPSLEADMVPLLEVVFSADRFFDPSLAEDMAMVLQHPAYQVSARLEDDGERDGAGEDAVRLHPGEEIHGDHILLLLHAPLQERVPSDHISRRHGPELAERHRQVPTFGVHVHHRRRQVRIAQQIRAPGPNVVVQRPSLPEISAGSARPEREQEAGLAGDGIVVVVVEQNMAELAVLGVPGEGDGEVELQQRSAEGEQADEGGGERW
jgi:hypothetical protein